MKRNCIAVMGYKAVEETIKRHAQFWKKPGWGLIGLSPNDGTIWPDEFDCSLSAGKSSGPGPEMIERLVGFLFMASQICTGTLVIVEYDQLIIGEMYPPSELFSCELAPNYNPKFNCEMFCHTPWIFNGEMAYLFAMHGLNLFRENRIEFGSADRFMALIAKEINCKPAMVLGSVTRVFDKVPEELADVRKRIEDGEVQFVHAIKTETELRQLIG